MGKRMIIFDMDGTITVPAQRITEEMKQWIRKCKDDGFDVSIATGSDYASVLQQIGENFLKEFRYVFTVNGTVAHADGKLIQNLRIVDVIPNDILKRLVQFCLMYIAQVDIPVKRGTFVEFRTGLINICPVGRNCSQQEREDFALLDKERGIRKELVRELRARFSNIETPIKFTTGGQISIDAFPLHWNKSLALEHMKEYDDIYFFGDSTHEGGNDYEICFHPDVKGTTVKDYRDTIFKLKELLDR